MTCVHWTMLASFLLPMLLPLSPALFHGTLRLCCGAALQLCCGHGAVAAAAAGGFPHTWCPHSIYHAAQHVVRCPTWPPDGNLPARVATFVGLGTIQVRASLPALASVFGCSSSSACCCADAGSNARQLLARCSLRAGTLAQTPYQLAAPCFTWF